MKKFNDNLSFYFLTGALALFLFFVFSPNVRAETVITDNIQADTTWTQDGNPYILQNNIDVALGVTLTIGPGVVVKFDPTANVSITVFGDLVVNGELGNEVYFTSNYDDMVGGDSNGDYFCDPELDDDGNQIGEMCETLFEPSRNDWQGINFIDSHNNYIKNAVFKYASDVAYLEHTYLNVKNIQISNSDYGLITNTSNVDANNINCADLTNSCLMAFSSSNVNWINSLIDTISNDAISIFNSSSLNISHTIIRNISGNSHNGISVFSDSSVVADYLDFSNGSLHGDYITVYDHSNLTLNNSTMMGCSNYACIEVFDGGSYLNTPSSLNIENSVFSGGAYDGISIFGDSVITAEIHHSKIVDFSNFSIDTFGNAPKIINAEDNFWGNDTGPFHPDENPTGTGGIVGDYIDFIPFCENEKCKARDPVILIPGIMGTEIFKNFDDNKEIWPNLNKLIFSISDNFLNDLALNIDGTEDVNKPMQLGDIIRGIHLNILGVKYDSKTYEGLIKELERNGYIENTNLFVFPYDWRKSNADSAEKLKEKIDKILTDTGAEKVDLVAHSMGGLVAKKYIAENGGNKIDQLIFIGTPQLGAPKAFKVIMEGDDMGIAKGKYSFLTPSKVKYIVQNMPGVFELLPSKKYIDGQGSFSGEKYITDYITPSLSNSENPVRPDLSYKETKDFLKNQKINNKMLDFSDNLHNDIDNLDLSEMKVSNFIGCGTTKTIGRIIVKKKSTGILFWKKLVNTYDLEYENGDDTVPLHSADDSSGKKYYVKGSTHGEIPSAFGIEELVTMVLREKELTDFPNVSSNEHDCFIKGKTISFYSMLPMMEYLVYDNLGNYTGPVKSIDLKSIQDLTETEDTVNEIEYGIPGVQYDKIGLTTSIFLPAGGSYTIVVNSISSSGGGGGGSNVINTYDLNIQNINADDTTLGSVNFNNIPVDNSDESFQVVIPSDTFPGETNANIPPVVQVDENGDGTYENEIPPTVVLNDTQTNDVSVPNTTSIVAGDTVSLLASDDNSGVSNTRYSLDGGNTWAFYTVPFTVNLVEGGDDVVIEYFSTDNAGNVEVIQIITIPAPPLPIPVITNIPSTHSSGGGIWLLNSNNNLQDQKGLQRMESQTLVRGLSLGNSDILENKITKEVKEPILNNIVDLKSTVFKVARKPSPVLLERAVIKSTKEQSLKESQTAALINSNFNFKPIWVFIIILILSWLILIVRNYKKG